MDGQGKVPTSRTKVAANGPVLGRHLVPGAGRAAARAGNEAGRRRALCSPDVDGGSEDADR